MPLLGDAPWSTCPVTVSVPLLSPGAVWGSMFALLAALKPAKPSVRALPIDLSRPRYARRACSSDDTCVPPHATATRNSAVGQAFLSMRTRPLEPSAGHAIRPPRGLSPTVLLGIHRPQDVRRCRKLAYWPGR